MTTDTVFFALEALDAINAVANIGLIALIVYFVAINVFSRPPQ